MKYIFIILMLTGFFYNLKSADIDVVMASNNVDYMFDEDMAIGGLSVEDPSKVILGEPLFSFSMEAVSESVWDIYEDLIDDPYYDDNEEELKNNILEVLVDWLSNIGQNLNDLGSNKKAEIIKYISDIVDNHEAMDGIDIKEV